MRFILGIDAYVLDGNKIERSLRPYLDIAEYDILPYWAKLKSIPSKPEAIQARAQALVDLLHRDAERALYYIGLTRGFYLKQVPIGGRLEIFSVCLDIAVATDGLKNHTRCVCLNSNCASKRLESVGKAPLCDDIETFTSLLTLINSFCLENSKIAG